MSWRCIACQRDHKSCLINCPLEPIFPLGGGAEVEDRYEVLRENYVKTKMRRDLMAMPTNNERSFAIDAMEDAIRDGCSDITNSVVSRYRLKQQLNVLELKLNRKRDKLNRTRDELNRTKEELVKHMKLSEELGKRTSRLESKMEWKEASIGELKRKIGEMKNNRKNLKYACKEAGVNK